MDQRLKKSKQQIRSFIREHYTDQRLVEVLAFAQDGKFEFNSCCCLIGAATADELGHRGVAKNVGQHYELAGLLSGAEQAEYSFCNLGFAGGHSFIGGPIKNLRKRRIIPILRAEIRRRERIKNKREERLDLRLVALGT